MNKAIDHWRKVFAACVDQDEKHKTKPFEGWNVVIYSTESRGAPFKRIIQAGGGFVMRIRIGLKIISLNINIETSLFDESVAFYRHLFQVLFSISRTLASLSFAHIEPLPLNLTT